MRTIRIGSAALVFALASITAAAAQSAGGNAQPDANGPASPPPSAATTVQSGQGGVAGTGLGTVPVDDTTGKGTSVKGPAGQLVPSDTSKAK